MKRFMFVNRRAPHGTVYALEALEATLVAGVFEQQVSVVFMDDGVFALRSGQDTSVSGLKNFSPAWRALADHGVQKLYVEQESLLARNLSPGDLLVPVTVIGAARLGELMAEQDVVFSF